MDYAHNDTFYSGLTVATLISYMIATHMPIDMAAVKQASDWSVLSGSCDLGFGEQLPIKVSNGMQTREVYRSVPQWFFQLSWLSIWATRCAWLVHLFMAPYFFGTLYTGLMNQYTTGFYLAGVLGEQVWYGLWYYCNKYMKEFKSGRTMPVMSSMRFLAPWLLQVCILFCYTFCYALLISHLKGHVFVPFVHNSITYQTVTHLHFGLTCGLLFFTASVQFVSYCRNYLAFGATSYVTTGSGQSTEMGSLLPRK